MTTFVRKKSRVKEGRGGYHQEDVKHANAGVGENRSPRKRWLVNIRDYMKEYNMTDDMAQNRNVSVAYPGWFFWLPGTPPRP